VPRSHEEIQEVLETTWVAEEGGQLVGCCCLDIYSPKIAEVRSLFVDPQFRGRGLGEDLVRAAVEEAERRKIRQVITITSSPDFFGKLDFGPCLNEKYILFWQRIVK
jgi:amino-acid N-acetyltransferase